MRKPVSDYRRRVQTVEKPFLKVKLHKREKEKFWSSFFKSLQDFHSVNKVHGGRSPWPLLSSLLDNAQ